MVKNINNIKCQCQQLTTANKTNNNRIIKNKKIKEVLPTYQQNTIQHNTS